MQSTLAEVYNRWEAMHAPLRRKASSQQIIQQSSWAYTAITFIAETLMRTHLGTFRNDVRLDSHPIEKFLNRPNAYDDQNTSGKFRYAYFTELLMNGSVMRILGGLVGFKPSTMSVRPRWQFRPTDQYDDMGRCVPLRWTLNHGGQVIDFMPGDSIYHDALYNPLHDYEGLAPLTAALLSVSNDTDVVEFASRFFANDGSTGMVLSTDNPAFTQTQADDAAKKWKNAHSGLEHAFGVRFVGFGLKPHSIGTPLDADLVKILRTLTKEEIFAIYKIPPEAVTAADSGGDIVIGGPSGGTQASAREAFLVNVAMPWAMRYDEDFNRDITWRFDPSVQVKHDFSDNPILERRRLERAQAAVQLIDRGVPLNEIIRWLRLDIMPQAWGDEWWVENDKLPASVVLNAGDKALKIAIPDPPGQAERRDKSGKEYVDSIVSLAQQVGFAEGVRGEIRRNGFGGSRGSTLGALAGVLRQQAPPASIHLDGEVLS